MSETRPGLITVAELKARLDDPALRVIDASYYLPSANRDPKAEFDAQHIPGAVFFDIDAVSDRSSPLPHMLPDEAAFAEAVGAMGIGTGDEVVVYDTTPMFGACRVWWMFRAFGHERVRVLDGGLPSWLADGHPVEAVRPDPEPRRFTARLDRGAVQDLAHMKDRVAGGDQIVDARSAARFEGGAPEPRAGLRLGHMPSALNLPFGDVLDPDTGRMLGPEDLHRRFDAAGLDRTRPTVVSCGSGVTACVVALALHTVGTDGVSIYDGSWAEWGSLPDTPVVAAEPATGQPAR